MLDQPALQASKKFALRANLFSVSDGAPATLSVAARNDLGP